MRSFFVYGLCATFALGTSLVSGCVQATNPCDPESDESLQQQTSLFGVVLTERGTPAAGVTILVTGRSETTVSGDDGKFELEGLLTTEEGVEVVALPPSPAVGGRALSPPLLCKANVGSAEAPAVTLRVISPPPPPEVEITDATDRHRLFAAFGSVGDVDGVVSVSRDDSLGLCAGDGNGAPIAQAGKHTYRIQVRAPFRPWQDALVSTDPRDALDDAPLHSLLDQGRIARGLDEECGISFCGHFSYVHDSVGTEPTARCTEIVGIISGDGDDEVFSELEAFGSYEVRVRAVLTPPAELIAQQVPSAISSADVPSDVSLTLVPTSILPVVLDSSGTGNSVDAEHAVDVNAIVPTGDGRFAIIDSGGMKVVSSGVAAASFANEEDHAHSDAMGIDSDTTTRAEDEVAGTESGHALAVLPAGKWVRVWKRLDDGSDGARSMVDKVFIGANDGEEQAGDAGDEPRFDFEVSAAGLDAFRSIAWLTRPEGEADSADYDPEDGYMLLFKRGFVLAEVTNGSSTQMGAIVEAMEGDADGLPVDLPWDDSDSGASGLGGFCSNMGATGIDGNLARACFDLEQVVGEEIDLRGVDTLVNRRDPAPPVELHLFIDRRNDRVLAVRTAELLGRGIGSQGARPLIHAMVSLSVGASPTAMQRSKRIYCEGDSPPDDEEVMLVANAGSGDISVIDYGGAIDLVTESASIPLDIFPTGFLNDGGGPTCDDPFVWVTGENGEAVPVDMRADKMDAPMCGARHCSVSTGTRSPVGAVSRSDTGRSRALVGGRGVLGELNYLRPAQ